MAAVRCKRGLQCACARRDGVEVKVEVEGEERLEASTCLRCLETSVPAGNDLYQIQMRRAQVGVFGFGGKRRVSTERLRALNYCLKGDGSGPPCAAR